MRAGPSPTTPATAPRPEDDHAVRVHTRTIGEAWIAVAARILADGADGTYDGLSMRELLMATLVVDEPDGADALIARHADPGRLAWMHRNFTDHAPVAALGDADSYASRLFDYARRGRDQVAWATERLRADPCSRSATITTFQPLTDTTYVPCVSLLDFFVVDGCLRLSVYAHSIDFGAKGYGNLVELATLQHRVAADLSLPVGEMTMLVKSAHVYASDSEAMGKVLADPSA